jgi:acetyl esterase/lipase
MTSSRTLVVLSGLVLVLAACGGTAPDGASNASSGSPSPSRSVAVQHDVAYATVPEDWVPAAADVYQPTGASGSPVVVLLHGGGTTRTDFQYPEIATALAARGAVVVVPSWGPATSPGGRAGNGWPADRIVDEQRAVVAEVACAFAFAVDTGRRLGGDASRLVVLGHSAGATLAAQVALHAMQPGPGCSVAGGTPTVHGMLLWDGDWLMSDETFDVIGPGLPALIAAYSPWPSVATTSTEATVTFAVTARSASSMFRAVDRTSTWLADRDASGTLTRDLEGTGALSDGQVDVTEVTTAFASALKGHGIASTTIRLDQTGTSHTTLAAADLETVVTRTLASVG